MRQYDWATTSLGTPDRWPQSLRTTLSILLNSRFPMFLYWGRELVCFYNDAYRPSLGHTGKHPAALGQPGEQVWPEIWPIIKPQIDQVLAGGEASWHEDKPGAIYRNGRLDDVYWTYSYSPVADETGQVAGVFVTCMETTRQVITAHRLAQSETRFRSLVEQAPIATCLFVGRELRIDIANAPMLALWGKGNLPLGRPLAEALPELRGQPFLQILDDIFNTGETYSAKGMRADLEVDGAMGAYYVNFTYKPLFDQNGNVYAIIGMVVDVTQERLVHQQLADNQLRLSLAIEASQLGIWELDLIHDTSERSWRHDQIFGYTEPLSVWGRHTFREHVYEPDRSIADACFQQAFQTGKLAMQVRIQKVDGTVVWIDVHGKTLYDPAGNPARLLGTIADITVQKEVAQDLERLVAERTQALELANQDLQRSNENLQQFAYIASHDLQEPLRKIQSFSSILEQRYREPLGQEGTEFLQRITSAGARMSTLIRDLLAYSRISTRQQTFDQISLHDVVTDVLNTLDWEIAQRGAQIELDTLPTVRGDKAQLGQLVQNLLTNAIKFTPEEEAPRIRITSRYRNRSQLPELVRPTSEAATFVEISVRDHGIGFDTRYLDRIFQVFQRLHGKARFPGTGIGLAICQRVVENHGGGITADSHPGEGATFCVYLPA